MQDIPGREYGIKTSIDHVFRNSNYQTTQYRYTFSVGDMLIEKESTSAVHIPAAWPSALSLILNGLSDAIFRIEFANFLHISEL